MIPHRARPGLIALSAILALLVPTVFAAEQTPVVTTVADFDDDSVATTIASVQNVLRSACDLKRSNVPARGQRCLQLEIGVTGGQAAAVVDFRLREARRFDQADRIAAFCWLSDGAFDVSFRIRDARDQVFETPARTIATTNRWTYVEIPFEPEKLKRLHGEGELSWPIQFQGFQAGTSKLGKQTIYLDDFQIEHRVERRAMVRGEFVFDEPTRIYEPGATVQAALALENCSRKDKLQMSVELAWTRPDGSVLKTQSGSKSLPASGLDFRSRQSIDFSLKIDQPGLYRLTARARAGGWLTPAVFQTSIAVTPRNTALSRGRSTFYGVRTGLVREPAADQRLEIAIARDIGVHLLAVEVPWRQIEPAAGKFDFSALDPVVSELTSRNIAPLMVLTDPPDWAPAGEPRVDAVATVFCSVAKNYGAALSLFQPDTQVLDSPDLANLLPALQRIQSQLKKVREHAALMSPPIPATPQNAAAIAPHLSASDMQWCIETEGDTHAALDTLESFARSAGISWDPRFWWLHRSAPLIGATHFVHAEEVLHYYVHAALAGVGGLIWYDLRDSDRDPAQPELMRGLVRRDFSPKASLLGYATAAGMLTGLACRGTVDGAPPEFESALFVGSDRHLAMLLPRPNRLRPAVLSVVQGVPGKLELRDFERRPFNPLTSVKTSLVPALDRPFFITLPLSSPQPEPQLAFGQSPVSLPATLFCGEAENTLTLTPPEDIRRGSLRLAAPRESALKMDSDPLSFNAKQGEARPLPLKLTRAADEPFESADASLKLTLDKVALEIPVNVRPLATVLPRTAAWPGQRDLFRVAELPATRGQKASSQVAIFAAYTRENLELLIAVHDDRRVPLRDGADGTTLGDDLLLGAAGDHAQLHTEVRVDLTTTPPELHPLHGGDGDQLPGWNCKLLSSTDQDSVYQLQIPARAFAADALSPGIKLRLAARYQDDDSDGLSPVDLEWGRGLDGARSSEGFRWLRLGGPD